MKTRIILYFFLIFSLLSCNNKNAGNKDTPGLTNDSLHLNSSEYLKNIDVPSDKQLTMASIPTIHPEIKSMKQTITVDGIISYDTRQQVNISSRYNGRIEKLYVKYMYQPINEGDLLIEIYSPEMVTQQNNLVFLLDHDDADRALINSSEKKLQLLGMTEAQIKNIENTKKVYDKLPVYSPVAGHIHEAGKEDVSSDNMNPGNGNIDELSVKEGMYVKKNQTIFNILNQHNVWAILKLNADVAGKIKTGQAVRMSVEGIRDSSIHGKIDFIEPVISDASRSLSARVYLENYEHKLKVGAYLKASIESGSVPGMWIPKSAVLDLGKKKIVWLKEKNKFIVHEIVTGLIIDESILVISGINSTDEIASNAQFIADSESFISTK